MNRSKSDLPPVASGPLFYETQSLAKARLAYSDAKPEENMNAFLQAFNDQNKFSMVAYPVGYHYDYFKKNKEFIENKILFVIPHDGTNHSVGRGGSIHKFGESGVDE